MNLNGYIVDISMANNLFREVVDGVISPVIDNVLVKHCPCATGDSFIFDKNGVEFILNPVSSDFVGMVIRKKPKTENNNLLF